jgi:hypothetical protein
LAQVLASSPPILDASSCALDASQSALLVQHVLATEAVTSLDLRGNDVDEETRELIGRRLLEDGVVCGLQFYMGGQFLLRQGQCWLDLRSVRLKKADLSLLGGLLRRNSVITGLDLSGQQLVDGEDKDGFATLNAISNGLSLGAHSNQLTSLSLCSTNLGDKGAIIMARALKTGALQLRSLALADNGLGQSGAEAITRVLEQMTKLTSFDVSRNRNLGAWSQDPILNMVVAIVAAGKRDEEKAAKNALSGEPGLASLRIADVGLIIPESQAEGGQGGAEAAGTTPEQRQLWHEQLRRLQRYLGPRTAPSIENYELERFDTLVLSSHARRAKAIMAKGGKELKDAWRGGAGLKGVRLDAAGRLEQRRLRSIYMLRHGHAEKAAALAMTFEHEKYRFGSKQPGDEEEEEEEAGDEDDAEGGAGTNSVVHQTWQTRAHHLNQSNHLHWGNGNGQLLLFEELLDTGRLQLIDLRDNYLGILGARVLSDALLGVGARTHGRSGCVPLKLTLHTLLLARCGLCGIHERYRCTGPSTYDDSGLTLLMHALSASDTAAHSNSTSNRLHTVDFSNNFIGFRRTESALDALVPLLRQNTTLSHLNLSFNFLGGSGHHKAVLGRSRSEVDRRQRQEEQKLAENRLSQGFLARAGGTPIVVNISNNGIDEGGLEHLRRHAPHNVTIVESAKQQHSTNAPARPSSSTFPATVSPPSLAPQHLSKPNATTPGATAAAAAGMSTGTVAQQTQRQQQQRSQGDGRQRARSFFKCVRVCEDWTLAALSNPQKKYTVGCAGRTANGHQNSDSEKTTGQLLQIDASRLDDSSPVAASTSPMGGGLEVDDYVYTNAVEACCSADMVRMTSPQDGRNKRPPAVVVRCRCWGRRSRSRNGAVCFANTRLLEVLPNRCALCQNHLPVHTRSGAPYAGTTQHTEADRHEGICTGIYPAFDL